MVQWWEGAEKGWWKTKFSAICYWEPGSLAEEPGFPIFKAKNLGTAGTGNPIPLLRNQISLFSKAKIIDSGYWEPGSLDVGTGSHPKKLKIRDSGY